MAVAGFVFEGVEPFKAAIDAMIKFADEGSRRAANNAAKAVASRTQRKLTTSSHKKGTPTPSQPGEPPSLITGQLRRSTKIVPAVPIFTGAWQSSVGPTAAYARVQELGGTTGRSGATRLPARPYLGPTVREMISSGELWMAFRSGWGA
jgi:phage gpG-like protein